MKKKFMAALCAVLVICSAVAVYAVEPDVNGVYVLSEGDTLDLKIHYIGDVTGDGKVNAADYLKVLAHAKNPESSSALTGYAFDCGDVNNDNRINAADYLKILSQAKGNNTLW